MPSAQSGRWAVAFAETHRELRGAIGLGSLPRNVAAGISTALVALPLNIALALACGLPASVGLVTGAVAGVIGGLLGGTRLQITGPEVALAPMTLAIVAQAGVSGLVWCTLLAGGMQIAFGLLRVGRFVRAIPAPVITGFMVAVGLIVLDTQLPRLLGMPDQTARLSQLAAGASAHVSLVALGVGGVAMASLILLPRIHPRLPAPLVAVGVPIGVVALLGLHLPHVPDIDSVLPSAGLPALSLDRIVALLPSAIGLALLASLDSLLSAVSLDARMGTTHRSDQELVAQGVANLVCGLVGGMPVAGAIVRSSAAMDAGGDTRAAPIVQSIVLGAVLVVLGAHLDVIPLAALAAILVVVGVKLLQPAKLRALYLRSRPDFAIAVVTAVAIVAWDFVLGIGVGVAAALAHQGLARAGLSLTVERDEDADLAHYRLEGPLVFTNYGSFAHAIAREVASRVVMDFTAVPVLDLSAGDALQREIARLEGAGTEVELRALRPSLAVMLGSAASPSSDARPEAAEDGRRASWNSV
ncbi:MAG: SulP family inorganic anion transporter [Sandaracinaceae bacterium]|nr:SulP family inorganic anion transporter [Sandaracinaceae bacterium]